MNKKFVIISLIAIAIVGSLVAFYGANLFFSDVSNFGAGFMNTTLFVTLPMMMFGAMLVAAPLYILRLYQRPNNKKALSAHYLIVAAVLAGLGFVFAILGGVLNMHSFVKPYPFPGYLIIMMVIHLLILAASAFVFFKFVKPMPEDQEKFKGGVKHVFHTLGLYLFIALAFNRFGAFLLMPVYVQWSTLYKTFVYFLFLLLPMALLVLKVLRILDLAKKIRFPMALVLAVLNVVLALIIMLLGRIDSSFISAVSAAAPLERLGSMPMELFIHIFAIFGVSVYYIIVEKFKTE